MNKYSKITGWRVKNFRNIGDIFIDFTESPIITLLGDNEAGKTSVVKTFGVLGCNAYSSEQKGYIRTGFDGFGIACSMEDGTTVYRFKKADSNYYKIEKPNEAPIMISKIDRGYGTPVEVEKVMGFVIEPETKEILQVRTYEDQLLFVLTKASENYKVMYNALKVENLTKAISAGNIEANEAKKTINSCEASIETLQESLKNIRIVDISNASKIKDRIKVEATRINKLEKVLNLIKRQNEISLNLGNLSELDKAMEISEMESYKLGRLESLMAKFKEIQLGIDHYSMLNKINSLKIDEIGRLERTIELLGNVAYIERIIVSYNDLDKSPQINLDTINRLQSLIARKQLIDQLDFKLEIYNGIDNYSDVNSLDTVQKLEKVIKLAEHNKNLDTSITDTNNEAESIYNQIRQCGVVVTECPNCGETVIVDRTILVS